MRECVFVCVTHALENCELFDSSVVVISVKVAMLVMACRCAENGMIFFLLRTDNSRSFDGLVRSVM